MWILLGGCLTGGAIFRSI